MLCNMGTDSAGFQTGVFYTHVSGGLLFRLLNCSSAYRFLSVWLSESASVNGSICRICIFGVFIGSLCQRGEAALLDIRIRE